MTRQELEKQIIIRREMKIRAARKSLWEFCKIMVPSFYKNDRTYLKELCDTLQALYERRIYKIKETDGWKIAPAKGIISAKAIICTKICISIPPQHGKSLTLSLFDSWILGKNRKEKIVTVSYNAENALTFSMNARTFISEKDPTPGSINYCDIFPDIKIAQGANRKDNWSLENEPFSFNSKGLESGVTGKGYTIKQVDDPIKDAATAFSPASLEKIWSWYTGTFASRNSGNNFIDIIVHTRWSKNDLAGKLLALQSKKWYVFSREVYDEKTDTMLCESILNKENYLNIKSLVTGINESIFYANYHNRLIDMQNRLYTKFSTYQEIPRDEAGNIVWEKIIAYVDTADTGEDYLCAVVAGIYQKKAYVLDVYYTQDPMEVTEYKTAELLYKNNVNIAHIEANNGGRGFARNVENILKTKFNSIKTKIKPFHQSLNKASRILTNSTNVMEDIYFPVDWHIRFPEFYVAMNEVNTKTVGTNRSHDDAPDAVTGIIEKMYKSGGGTRILN